MKSTSLKKQLIIIFIIFIALIILGIVYMTYMLNKIEANTNNSFKTIVKNDANNLKAEITEQKTILQSITNQILIDEIINTDKIFDICAKNLKNYAEGKDLINIIDFKKFRK